MTTFQFYLAVIIFCLTYVGIMSEKFPRTICALVGGGAMIYAGYVTQSEAFERFIDWNTLGLLAGIDGNIAGTGDDHGLALKAVVAHTLQSLGGEVAQAVAGGLGTGQRAAEGQALAGEHTALEAVGQTLVLAEHIADLAAADANITGGAVHELADVAVQLGHEALAEAHDFHVALAVGVEVGAALAAAHGQGGQAVLEGLLEAEELQDALTP